MTKITEKTHRPEIDYYRAVVALTEEFAPDHRGYLSDGDLNTDIEELYGRVCELIESELDESEQHLAYEHTQNILPLDLAFYQGCLNYYVNGDPSSWEEDVNPTEAMMFDAFAANQIKTPYTI
jgi:hypothetical protein